MPSDETSGLTTNCFLERNDPREVLISRDKKKFNDLNKGSIIGTSSLRREFQFKRIRNDLKYKLIRGNVDTRIKKLNEKNFDAIILSFAGLHSLKLDQNITQIFSTSEIIPSAGQGTIALQCRENDEEIIKILKKINHELTYKCVIAERDVLKTLNGDCETPVGVFANIKNNELLVNNIFNFIREKNGNIDKNFSVIVNTGPGSFSGIRISLAIAKGIKISKGVKIYGYRDTQLGKFDLKNIELLINKNLLQNKLIKPVYLR